MRWYLTVVLICISLWLVVLSTFSYTSWSFACLLWKKCFLRSLSHLKIGLLLFSFIIFFFLLLGCNSSLYILNIYLLSDIWFASIFYYSIVNLSILLIVSSALQKLFSLMWSPLNVFTFVVCALGVILKKKILRPILCPCFLLGIL